MKKTFLKKGTAGRRQAGVVLINVLIFGFIAMLVTTALANWAASLYKTTLQLGASEQAFQLAESGIEYYRWHLNYNPTDYKDGSTTSSNGPFIHTFADANGNTIGTFALTITPPPIGSTIVVVKSKGTVASSTVSRIIQASMAIPSLAKYAVIANDVMNFGSGTEVFGPIQSNNGIHFDGLAHNLVSSAMATYTDPDSNTKQWAVWTDVGANDPAPPTALPSRPDVFAAGRQLSVPAFDFTSLTANLSALKATAQAATTTAYFGASGTYTTGSGHNQQTLSYLGYHIVLKTNDTFDIYKIKSTTPAPNNCGTDVTAKNQSGWDTWSIAVGTSTNQTYVGNYPFPAAGVIFVEDNVWVDGQINTARITIAAGAFPSNPSTYKSITVNNNLLYTNKDGRDSIALIAQNNINAGLASLDTMEIDGALVAQNGRVGRYYYSSYCGTGYDRTTITLYGMIASDVRYGFAYSDGTGYANRIINYDSNMLYAPPPSFPLTSSEYSIISWGEVGQ